MGLLKLNRNPNLVYGSPYKRYRNWLNQTEYGYDPESRLLDVVNTSIREVPYYRKMYGDLQVTSVEDFERFIGFVDKNIILEHFDDFINPNVNLKMCDWGTTGGTSGKPLQLVAPKSRYIAELATIHTLWGRAGYDYHPRAVIRNHKMNHGDTYRINPITRELDFDGFRFEESYFNIIYETLKTNHIRFIHCYPSMAYEFSRYLYRHNRDVSFITAFLSGSENIFDYQVDLIQNKLGIRFYNWYGHSEKLILAGYCKHTNDYHVEPTYGYFELIDENGKIITEVGEVGEMVGTSFHNNAQVMIRYKTGDYAEYAGDYCPSCRRRVSLLRNIQGRWSGNRLYNADGTYVTTTALNLHNNLYAVVEGLQYIQERKGHVKVLIIKSPEYKEHHGKALYDHFRDKFKADTFISIEYVSRLQKLPNGKFVHIISHVKEI